MFFSKVFWMCVSSCKYWVIEVDAGLKIQCLSSSKRTFARFFLKHPRGLGAPTGEGQVAITFACADLWFSWYLFWLDLLLGHLGCCTRFLMDVMKQCWIPSRHFWNLKCHIGFYMKMCYDHKISSKDCFFLPFASLKASIVGGFMASWMAAMVALAMDHRWLHQWQWMMPWSCA